MLYIRVSNKEFSVRLRPRVRIESQKIFKTPHHWTYEHDRHHLQFNNPQIKFHWLLYEERHDWQWLLFWLLFRRRLQNVTLFTVFWMKFSRVYRCNWVWKERRGILWLFALGFSIWVLNGARPSYILPLLMP
jgi:hypothetical protein